MRTPHIVVVSLYLLAATTAWSAEVLPAAEPEEVGLSAEKLGRIVPAMKKLAADGRISGAVTAVARRGKVVHLEATGHMDIATKSSMRRDTIFRIYSMSKPITAAAALILFDEGKLDLDAPVSKYLPQMKDLVVLVDGKKVEPSREMTIRDLMRHTAGLTYGFFSKTPVDRLYLEANVLDGKGTLADMVEKLGKIPLLYHPGERWHYSVSLDVLGRVVEVVSGKPLDEFLGTRIFEPLGMVDTGFFVPKEKLGRFATNYGPGRNGLRVVDDPAKSRYGRPATFFSGGGGLVSTGADYLRFAQMLLDGGILGETRILEAKTVKAMTSNQLDEDLIPIRMGGFPLAGTGFGLGVSVRVARSASTNFWVVPDEELIGMVMTQHMPYSAVPMMTVKPLVEGAVVKEAREGAGVGK
jgi:CubicO group peptidase (beta-lactamase class C family)